MSAFLNLDAISRSFGIRRDGVRLDMGAANMPLLEETSIDPETVVKALRVIRRHVPDETERGRVLAMLGMEGWS